jgi:hypothetical protein
MAAPSTLTETQRRTDFGRWGELKAVALLRAANFTKVRDLNAPSPHHPFADILAERDGVPYIIGVKTRNKFQTDGHKLNADYNMVKRGADIDAIAARYSAQPAWVTIQTVCEQRIFWAYYGPLTRERLSVSMRPRDIATYECLANEESDLTILPEWTNRR